MSLDPEKREVKLSHCNAGKSFIIYARCVILLYFFFFANAVYDNLILLTVAKYLGNSEWEMEEPLNSEVISRYADHL